MYDLTEDMSVVLKKEHEEIIRNEVLLSKARSEIIKCIEKGNLYGSMMLTESYLNMVQALAAKKALVDLMEITEKAKPNISKK